MKDLTPAQEEAVRRHLAAARHTDPLPDEVAARLDDVIAGLAASHAASPPETPLAPVVTLDSRRRRRATQLLVAAAAVVVVGVGGPAMLDNLQVSGEDASTSETASDGQAAEGPAEGDAGDSSVRSPTDGSVSTPGNGPGVPSSSVPEYDTGAVPDRAGELKGYDSMLTGTGELEFQLDSVLDRRYHLADAAEAYVWQNASRGERACVTDLGARTSVVVGYRGRLGALVVLRPVGGVQRVDLYVCGRKPTYVHSVILPAR